MSVFQTNVDVDIGEGDDPHEKIAAGVDRMVNAMCAADGGLRKCALREAVVVEMVTSMIADGHGPCAAAMLVEMMKMVLVARREGVTKRNAH